MGLFLFFTTVKWQWKDNQIWFIKKQNHVSSMLNQYVDIILLGLFPTGVSISTKTQRYGAFLWIFCLYSIPGIFTCLLWVTDTSILVSRCAKYGGLCCLCHMPQQMEGKGGCSGKILCDVKNPWQFMWWVKWTKKSFNDVSKYLCFIGEGDNT